MTTKMLLEGLITEAQLIKRLRLSRSTIYRLRNREDNPIPHYELPTGGILYNPKDVDAWAKSCEVSR